MNKLIIILLFWLCQIPLSQAHFETVATLEFSHHNGKLYIKAILEKRQLAVALAHEADCVPKDMMNICSERYFKDHIKLKLNGQDIELVREGLELQKNYLVMTFRVDNAQSVENIEIESDYLLAYNNHAITKYITHLGEKTRYFSTKDSFRKITIKRQS